MENKTLNSATPETGALTGSTMTNNAAATSRDTQFGGTNANRSHRGGGAFRMRCPHCNALAKTRSSEAVTTLVRELRFQCTNVDGDNFCGATFVASLEINRMIVQSASPNPRIKLPIAPPRAPRSPRGPAALPAPQT